MSTLSPGHTLRYVSNDAHSSGKEDGGSVKIFHDHGGDTAHIATAQHIGAGKFKIKAESPKYDNTTDRVHINAGVEAHYSGLKEWSKQQSGSNVKVKQGSYDSSYKVPGGSKMSKSQFSPEKHSDKDPKQKAENKEPNIKVGHTVVFRPNSETGQQKEIKVYHPEGEASTHVATVKSQGAGQYKTTIHNSKYDNVHDKSTITAAAREKHKSIESWGDKAPPNNISMVNHEVTKDNVGFKMKKSEESINDRMDAILEMAEELVKSKQLRNYVIGSYPSAEPTQSPEKVNKILPAVAAAARAAPAAIRAVAASPTGRSMAAGALSGAAKGYKQTNSVSGAVSGALRGAASGALRGAASGALTRKGQATEDEPKDPLQKPPVSEAQRRAMHAAAGGKSTLGIPKSVGKEFAEADKGGKLPEKKKDKANKAESIKHPEEIANITLRHKGVIPAGHQDRQAMASYITKLNSSGNRGEALRLYENHISGTPGDYTAGVKKSDILSSVSVEALTKSIRSKFKDSEITDMMKAAYDLGKIHYTTLLEWQNFKTINPSVLEIDRTPSASSIQPSLSKSEELASNEFELVEWDNGDFDLIAGKDVPEKYIDFIAKSMCAKNGCEEVKDDDKAEKKDRCWDGYEPTPGKKAYEKGSCQPVKKAEDMSGDKVDSSMMMGDLTAIKKHADEIMQHVDHKDVAPDWVKSKVAESASHLSAVADYVAGLSKSETEESLEKKKKSFNLKAKHKSDKGGLTEEGRKAYNRATGSNLKKPQPEGGPRKRSFCARNKGQIDMHNIDCKKTPEKRACKARRRWKC